MTQKENSNKKTTKKDYKENVEFEKLIKLDAAVGDLKKVYNEWLDIRNSNITSLIKMATELDKIETDVGITKTTGGGTSILGGIVSFIGMVTLNPIIFGSGLAIGVAGGGTALTGTIIGNYWDSEYLKLTKERLEKDKEKTNQLEKKIRDVLFMSKKLSEDHHFVQYCRQGFQVGVDGFMAINTLKNAVQIFPFVNIGGEVGKEAAKQMMYGPVTVLEGISKWSMGLRAIGVGVTFIVGIIDVSVGINSIVGKSKKAKELREMSDHLKKSKQDTVNKVEKFLKPKTDKE
jgi:hypothetical protein